MRSDDIEQGFAQPIEMRINEMVSGVRADLGVKPFGDDFTVLVAKAQEIERVLNMIRSEPGCLLARMSGSGPTCFGIFESDAAAEGAARRISEKKRKYWVRATTFRGASA